MDQKLIIFDIDRTLFNTWQYTDDICKFASQNADLNFAEAKLEFQKYFESLTNLGDFSVKDFLEQIRSDETYFHKDFSKYVYQDVRSSISLLHNNGFRIGVFSEGPMDVQYEKLKALNINDFLDLSYVYITNDKLRDSLLSQIPDNTIIVDDKLSILERVYSFNKTLQPILIDRLKEQPLQKIKDIRVITELKQLVGLKG